MLSSLRIENVVLIERLDLAFDAGLCALTGETGAGKSILLDSLGLALGARSDAGLVRAGADKAHVVAAFDIAPDHALYDALQEAGIEAEDQLILRRMVGADGRSKAYINDQPVSAGLLRRVGESVLEIHGQFDTRGLLDPRSHRALLDEYAGVDAAGLSAAWSSWHRLKIELEELRAASGKARAEEAYLRQAIEDLDGLDPKQGEEEHLSALRDRLMSREQVLEALNIAYHALEGEDDPVRTAWGAVDRLGDKLGPEGAALVDTLSRASAEMQEAAALIQSMSVDLQESEHSLESIDDRLFALRGQARKHGCEVDELPALRERLAGQLNMIEDEEGALSDLTKRVEQARAAYLAFAQGVRARREDYSTKLDELVAQELPPLKLERARFVTDVSALDEQAWGPHGTERVEFLIATNPGSAPGALGKIASGGELSRFMLALKVVLSEVGGADSLIFDEVDAGIGGGTADAVGERLARLALDKQILVVTHSPQVAARATHHYVVQKGGADTVRTSVVRLENRAQRAEEIARMLAGAIITDEAIAAADKLLQTGT